MIGVCAAGVQAQCLPSTLLSIDEPGAPFAQGVGVSGDIFVAGAPNAQAAYIYRFVDGEWVLEAERSGPSNHGFAVAASGEWVMVGAFNDNQVRVYRDNGGDWDLFQTLTGGDSFGISIAMDGTRAIVGARSAFGGMAGTGSARIFSFDGESWIIEATVFAKDGESGDNFGTSVDVCGDLAIAGAPRTDNEGAAYVFRYDGAQWDFEKKLTANVPSTADVGQSVSIGDGFVVVGASNDTGVQGGAGSAYVYLEVGDDWPPGPQLIAPDGENTDRFGYAAAALGDVVFIAATRDDDCGDQSGSVFAFRRTLDESWELAAKLTPLKLEGGDYFGVSMTYDGQRLVVGAPTHNVPGDGVGAAFVFDYDCPPCRADLNCDCAVNILDFVALQNTFSAGKMGADINGDGRSTSSISWTIRRFLLAGARRSVRCGQSVPWCFALRRRRMDSSSSSMSRSRIGCSSRPATFPATTWWSTISTGMGCRIWSPPETPVSRWWRC